MMTSALDRIVAGIHRNHACADLQILGFFQGLADFFRIIAAGTFDRIDQHLACIVTEGRKDIWCLVVFPL